VGALEAGAARLEAVTIATEAIIDGIYLPCMEGRRPRDITQAGVVEDATTTQEARHHHQGTSILGDMAATVGQAAAAMEVVVGLLGIMNRGHLPQTMDRDQAKENRLEVMVVMMARRTIMGGMEAEAVAADNKDTTVVVAGGTAAAAMEVEVEVEVETTGDTVLVMVTPTAMVAASAEEAEARLTRAVMAILHQLLEDMAVTADKIQSLLKLHLILRADMADMAGTVATAALLRHLKGKEEDVAALHSLLTVTIPQ